MWRRVSRVAPMCCGWCEWMLTDSVSVDGDHIDVIIVGEMIKLRNYYTGRWVSRYSLDVSENTIFVRLCGFHHA